MPTPGVSANLGRSGSELERMLRITDSLPVLISQVGADGRYEFVNQAYGDWFGMQRSEIVGKSVREMLGARAFEAVRPAMEAALRGERITYETTAAHPRGGPRHVRVTYVPQRDRSGRVVGFAALILDTTEQKRAERRLQILAEASAAFTEAALDTLLLVQTIARKITDAIGDCCQIRLLAAGSDVLEHAAFFHRDPEAQRLVGKMFSEIPLRLGEGVQGKVALEQKPMLVAKLDLAELLRQTKPEFRAVVAAYPGHSLMVVPLKMRGQTLGVLAMARGETAEPYDDHDLCLVEDLADRASMAVEVCQLLDRDREAIRRTTALADASMALHGKLDHRDALATIVRIAAVAVGDACVATLLEEGTLRATFASDRDPAVNERLQRFVGQEVPLDRGLAAEVMRSGKSLRIVDARNHPFVGPATAEYRALVGYDSLLIAPLRAGGQTIGTLGLSRNRGRPYTASDEVFLQDLADRAALVVHGARLYQAAKLARAQAETASALKDEFLSAASHELRTPITSLQLLIQTTMRQLRRMGDKQVDAAWVLPRLEKAERQGKRLIALTETLLDASRISAGRLRLDPGELDLCELVRTVATRFEEQAAERGTTIDVMAAGPVIGCWDADRLDQVVTNLVTNALKYGNEKPVTISVHDAGPRVVVSVHDRGIGIAEEHLDRIFERFERAEPVRNFGGFGVGLWIVREILAAMGGEIRVESVVGTGSTFTFELPR
jgi:PAS domain S-box-containing protein